jgi:hypothetical protein
MPFIARVERGRSEAARSASTKGVPTVPFSIPFEHPLLPGVPESGQQDADKHKHLDEA